MKGREAASGKDARSGSSLLGSKAVGKNSNLTAATSSSLSSSSPSQLNGLASMAAQQGNVNGRPHYPNGNAIAMGNGPAKHLAHPGPHAATASAHTSSTLGSQTKQTPHPPHSLHHYYYGSSARGHPNPQAPYESHRSAVPPPPPASHITENSAHRSGPGPYTAAQFELGQMISGALPNAAPGYFSNALPAARTASKGPAGRDGPPPPIPPHPHYPPPRVHGLGHPPQPSHTAHAPPKERNSAQPMHTYPPSAYSSAREDPHLGLPQPPPSHGAPRWQPELPYTQGQPPTQPQPQPPPPPIPPTPTQAPSHNFYEAAQQSSGTSAKTSRSYVSTNGYAPPPPAVRASIEPGVGPYRFSDPTLRRQQMEDRMAPRSAITTTVITNGNSTASVDPDRTNEVDGREGATSPSQIESSHREEVTTMGCTCKKTKCLKLYCQCFAVKIYCGVVCRCLVCHNTIKYEKDRKDAIRNILNRNPNAFDTKFKKTANGSSNSNSSNSNSNRNAISSVSVAPVQAVPKALGLHAQRVLAHKLGCKCRKSACMKKYCECYAGNVKCSINCRCVGCKNMPPGGLGPRTDPTGAAVASTKTTKAIESSSVMDADIPNPPKRREKWMMNAAQNLAFLKHASTTAAQTEPRRVPSDVAEVGSMPSLASENSPQSPDRTSEDTTNGSTSTLQVDEDERTDPEKTAVNALLMAARAMTNFDANRGEWKQTPSDTTTPTKKKAVNQGTSYETPTKKKSAKAFRSPKRKQAEKIISNDSDGQSRNSNSTECVNNLGVRRDSGTLQSSPSTASEEESPKRMNEDTTPGQHPKVKRSRLGSLKKGRRNLNGEMNDVKESKQDDTIMKDYASTPNQKIRPAEINLTPVSALSQRYTKHTISVADTFTSHPRSPQAQK